MLLCAQLYIGAPPLQLNLPRALASSRPCVNAFTCFVVNCRSSRIRDPAAPKPQHTAAPVNPPCAFASWRLCV